MSEQSYLFEEFSANSLEEWTQKAIKDLKGKKLEDLEWQVEENISISPFYHPDHQIGNAKAGKNKFTTNHWEIGEYLETEAPRTTNEAALEALNGGTEALLFRFKRSYTEEDLQLILENINLSFISTHFELFFADKKPYELLLQFYSLLEARNEDTEKIRGSVDFDPILDWVQPPVEQMKEAILFCNKNLPAFKILQVNGRIFHAGNEYSSRELALSIAKANEYMAYFTASGLSPEVVNQHMQFSLSVGNSYFVEIAKIRALRILWANVMKAYTSNPGIQPDVVVHLAPETQVEDIYSNMICATTQAMSAVIGGADRLYVLPANAIKKEPDSSFTRRIARNVQHLLKMESYMDRVIDPSEGSFYIEKLTDALVEEAWLKFKEYDARGEFSI